MERPRGWGERAEAALPAGDRRGKDVDSLELNDELNIAVFDRSLADRLTSDFEADLRQSQKLDLDTWRSRPLHIRAREKLWSYFGEVF